MTPPAIGVLTLHIQVEDSHSLKEKRHVVKSLKDRLRAHFNVSVAEIDNFHGIVVHDEQIAGLQVTVNEPAAMSGLQPAARLADDLDPAFRGKSRLSGFHECVERCAWQKRHREVRPVLAVFDEVTDIQNVDDIRMAELRKHAPFLLKKVNG